MYTHEFVVGGGSSIQVFSGRIPVTLWFVLVVLRDE